MKNSLASVCVVMALALSALGQEGTVTAQVPFQFVLGDKTFSAGEYGFWSDKETVFVQNQQGKRIAILLANHVAGHSKSETGQVVFDCYQSQCFLSQIWSPLQNDGRQVLRTRLQTELAARKPGTYVALAGKK